MSAVQVEPLEDKNRFLAAYGSLLAQADGATIFQSPAWIEAWLEGAPSNVALWTIAAFEGGETVLLGVVGAPKRKHPAALGAQAAHLFEFGVPDSDAIYTEYNDFLIRKEASPESRSLAIEAALDQIGPFDEFVVRNARAPLVEAARHVAEKRGHDFRILNEQSTYVADLDAAREAGGYLASKSASFRTQIRRAATLYEARGNLSLTLAETPEERRAARDDLIRLHEAAWRARGRRGVFSNAALTSFHRRLEERAPDCVHLLTLSAGDEALACLYNLAFDGCIYNYQSGFKFEEDNRLKPGLLTHAMAADFYMARGYRRYDFLAGDAPYKTRLGGRNEQLTSFAIDCGEGAGAAFRRTVRRARTRRRS
ncbi:MAG TPA: GNAT family N-acetyltransferase [Parvularculaceae bacterium]|nr:GNAT family N-acetyltransferase [Parvularculaceae bacterium]